MAQNISEPIIIFIISQVKYPWQFIDSPICWYHQKGKQNIEIPPLVKSKLIKKIKYRIVLIFCVSPVSMICMKLR